ncbi:hypothetical protein FRB95_013693 [Tulasnella sp. JGI-2019a]|nr:hypothetical protein FRB93_000682 [Tulasnella sp. JGI-2019a]KAG9034174.1 hypothetical protein FRB95_013693 [Tulasnella sp. JGI-2019a]
MAISPLLAVPVYETSLGRRWNLFGPAPMQITDDVARQAKILLEHPWKHGEFKPWHLEFLKKLSKGTESEALAAEWKNHNLPSLARDALKRFKAQTRAAIKNDQNLLAKQDLETWESIKPPPSHSGKIAAAVIGLGGVAYVGTDLSEARSAKATAQDMQEAAT